MIDNKSIVSLDSIGERLRFIRKSKGMTREEFSMLVGIPVRALGGYERSEWDMNTRVITQLCNTLKVSADFLVLGKDLHTEKMNMLLKAQDNVAFKKKVVGGRVEVTLSVPVVPEYEE